MSALAISQEPASSAILVIGQEVVSLAFEKLVVAFNTIAAELLAVPQIIEHILLIFLAHSSSWGIDALSVPLFLSKTFIHNTVRGAASKAQNQRCLQKRLV